VDNSNDKPIGSMDVNNQLQQWNHRLKQVTSQIVHLEQHKSRIETEIERLKDLLVQSKGEGVPLSDEKIKERTEEADHNKAQETEKQPTGTILIVDDVKMMRMTLSRALRLGGYRVVQTENGTQALDVLLSGRIPIQVQNKTQMVNVGGKAQMVNVGGEESIDLVIADITMPDMDGLELVQRMRSNTKTADLPVLICTISRKKDHIMRAAQLGVKGFLVKPISQKLVLEKVEKILNEQ